MAQGPRCVIGSVPGCEMAPTNTRPAQRSRRRSPGQAGLVPLLVIVGIGLLVIGGAVLVIRTPGESRVEEIRVARRAGAPEEEAPLPTEPPAPASTARTNVVPAPDPEPEEPEN